MLSMVDVNLPSAGFTAENQTHSREEVMACVSLFPPGHAFVNSLIAGRLSWCHEPSEDGRQVCRAHVQPT